MTSLLTAIALGFGLFGVPGYLAARVLRPDDDGIERIAMAGLVGPLLIGWLSLAYSVVSDRPMTLLVLAVAATLCVLGFGLLLRRSRTPLNLTWSRADTALALAAAGIWAIWLLHYDRQLFHFNCINRAAAWLLDAPGLTGSRPGDYILAENHNVRLGNVCLVAPNFVAFEFLGPRLLYAWTGGSLFLHGVVLARRVFSSSLGIGPSLALGLALALNPYVLAIPLVDENLLACLGTTVLLSSLAEDRPRMLWLALILGWTIGVRHIGLLMVPGVAYALWRKHPERMGWLRFGATLVAIGSLWAIHHHRVFGSMWVFESFREYQADYPHSLLGFEFGFRGLLNWPLHDTLIRTPYNPYPNGVMVLLWTLNRFGLLLCALAPLGFFGLRRSPLPGRVLAAIGLPILGLLAVLENSMQPNKLGIVLIVMPILVMAMVAGALELRRAQRRPMYVVLATLLVLGATQLALARWTAPTDERVYTLEVPVRAERPEVLAWEREQLIRHNLLPDLSRIFEYTPWEPSRKLSELWFDLTTRAGFSPTAPPIRSATQVSPVRLAIDLSKPLIGRGNFFVRQTESATTTVIQVGDTAWKRSWTLPTLDWSEQAGTVGLVNQPALGRVDVVLEFGELALLVDVGGEKAPTPQGALPSPRLVIEVPSGTSVWITEVVADHFSRYYRWVVSTDDGIRMATEPKVVFTN